MELAEGKQVNGEILAVDSLYDVAVRSIQPSISYLVPLWWEIDRRYWVNENGF